MAKDKPARTAPKPAKPAPAHELEGRKAPSFELPNADGRSVSLKELLGHGSVVLYFYPKDMTSGCTVEACNFRDNIARIRALGAQVAGISADSSPSHRKFRDKHELNFPLLSDTENRVTRLYGVYKKKSLYGRQFMGIERTTFVIDRSGVIRKVFPKVKVNGHTEAVVEAVKAIG